MHDGRIDELLETLGAIRGEPSLDAVDAICRARLQPEIARELAGGSRSRRFAPRAVHALTALSATALLTGAFVAPVTHGAINSVFNSFAGWVSGRDDAAPGRAVTSGDDIPSWIATTNGQKRVLAEAAGEQLVAIRSGDKLTLALADFGETGTIADLSKSVAGEGIQLVGPGRFTSEQHDRRTLFGVTSPAIKSIRFSYADGGPSVSAGDLTGAFGIVIDANRRPLALTGYDGSGRVAARLSFVADPRDVAPGEVLGDFRYCPAAGCVGWSK